jgi:hypothetical protein
MNAVFNTLCYNFETVLLRKPINGQLEQIQL